MTPLTKLANLFILFLLGQGWIIYECIINDAPVTRAFDWRVLFGPFIFSAFVGVLGEIVTWVQANRAMIVYQPQPIKDIYKQSLGAQKKELTIIIITSLLFTVIFGCVFYSTYNKTYTVQVKIFSTQISNNLDYKKICTQILTYGEGKYTIVGSYVFQINGTYIITYRDGGVHNRQCLLLKSVKVN